jgi:hypothetical protein
VILDGHDRAVAALAEGRTPPCIVLYRVPDDETWRRTADELTEDHEQRTELLLAGRATTTGTDAERRRAVLETAYEDTMSSLPYDEAPTLTWPLPGGAPAWDDLAARAVFECPRD